MTKYGQYCPIARSVEILGDRWTLLIIRDLLGGKHHFNELERGLPGIPRALLAGRLRHLQRVGVLERQVEAGSRKTRYELTQAGQELSQVIAALTHWGAKWAFGEPDTSELDPILLLWWMRDRVYTERLPRRRVVVEFAFQGPRRYTYWLVLQPADVSICLKHPGFDVDVLVRADLAALYKVWLGRMTFAEAVRDRQVELDTVPSLARNFPRWFAWSPIAETVRAETNH
ncbi:MAG: transcriptional regulator [Chloroflexi bacterium]|nr:MAG: transcriptional regulator [Chloroflexota bacterium]